MNKDLRGFIRHKLVSFRHIFMREGWRSYTSKDGKKWVRVKLPRGEWQSSFCADPFLFRYDGGNWLFFETMTPDSKGIIGCSKYEGNRWRWQGIALEEPWHLSYPQVFEEDGSIYMIPESCKKGAGDVCLYEAYDFPLKWRKVATLINEPFADSTLLRHDGHYYLFCYRREGAELWCSDALKGPWVRHPMCANINQSKRLRRCGGGFISCEGKLFRVAQDCNGFYGKRLFKVPVLEISPISYHEGDASLLIDRTDVPVAFKHTYNEIGVDDDALLQVIDTHHDVLRPMVDIVKNIISVAVKKAKGKG